MQKFIVSTDSGCDLSKEEAARLNISILNMSYTIDDVIYTDTMEVPALHKFYANMKNGAVPKTGSISIGEFYDYFKKLAEEKKPIVHMSLGSGISGTYMNSIQAKEMLIKEIPDLELILIDTTLASAGYGLLAIRAAEMRDNGMTAEECATEIEKVKRNIEPYFTTDDLTYLYRGGRVSKTGMIIANALGIQPILELDYEGHLRVCNKVRGRRQTWAKIASIIKERSVGPEKQTLFVSHSNCSELAKEFAEYIKKEVGFKDIYYTYIGTIIGAHTGPGLVALFFEGIERDQ